MCGKAPGDGMLWLGARNHRVGLVVDLICRLILPCTMYCVWFVLSCLVWGNCVKRRYNVVKRWVENQPQ